MNSLIIIREKHYSWLRGLGSADHPAMVTICNKPILEYMVDFIVMIGGKKIRLVFEEPDGSVEEYFGNGERWGVDIEYGNAQSGDTIAKVVEKNSSFGEQAPLIVIDGLLFIHYDKNTRYEIIPEGPGTGFLYKSENGSISYSTADAKERSSSCNLLAADTLFSRALLTIWRLHQPSLQTETGASAVPQIAPNARRMRQRPGNLNRLPDPTRLRIER